jgi:hypothetical protein
VEFEYFKPLNRWTHHDIIGVIDQVRRDMPLIGPDGERAPAFFSADFDPNDGYQKDGRALQCVYFDKVLRLDRVVHSIWFSTAAG